MILTLAESAVDKNITPSSTKAYEPFPARTKSMKAFIVIDEKEEAQNRSVCSSLTEDCDMTSNKKLVENFIAYGDGDLLSSATGLNRQKRNKSKTISYAQLMFDPETQMLVTLLQVNPVDRPCMLQIDPDANLNREDNDKSNLISFPVQVEARFQDQTLLTECSSISSVICREAPVLARIGTCTHRFSDEPLVFSYHRSCQLRATENDLRLHLLKDHGEPWDVSTGKSVGCKETLMRLLMFRTCISLASLRQVGEAKWNQISEKGQVTYPLLTSMAYSALIDG
jgi:hypothetical protein